MAARGARSAVAPRARVAAALAAVLAGCGGQRGSAAPAVGFPVGFLWGTATAGFQVEMG